MAEEVDLLHATQGEEQLKEKQVNLQQMMQRTQAYLNQIHLHLKMYSRKMFHPLLMKQKITLNLT